MFAVHGQHAHAVFARFAHHDFAGHDQDFLGGHGNVLARANGRQRRLQARRADDGDEHDVRRRQRGQFEQTLVAANNLAAGAERVLQFLGLGGIVDGNDRGLDAGGFVQQQFRIVARRQADQADLSGKSSATLTVLVPMEPVLPNKTTFFISYR